MHRREPPVSPHERDQADVSQRLLRHWADRTIDRIIKCGRRSGSPDRRPKILCSRRIKSAFESMKIILSLFDPDDRDHTRCFRDSVMLAKLCGSSYFLRSEVLAERFFSPLSMNRAITTSPIILQGVLAISRILSTPATRETPSRGMPTVENTLVIITIM